MGLCDGAVQSTGCAVAYQLEQKHNAVAGILGNRQIDTFPRLCGDLDDGITYSEERNGFISLERFSF